MEHEKYLRSWLLVLVVAAGLLTACGTATATPATRKQSPIAVWSDLEVQRVNLIRISETTVRVDVVYLIKLLKPDNYSFFFHFTDPAGKIVAQVDVSINPFSTGEVAWSQVVTLSDSTRGKLKVVMGRYSPVNFARLATVSGLEQVEIGVVD